MRRFLEYEVDTGRIVCDVYALSEPNVRDGHALLEVDAALTLDINNSAVRDGAIVRTTETFEERMARVRERQEARERAQGRIRHLIYDFMIAQIEDNKAKQKELKAEYKTLKARL